MKHYYGHTMPVFTKAVLDDAIFHYTTAAGLMGILSANHLWCTAAHCTNDESELAVGEQLLINELRKFSYELMDNNDRRVQIIESNGVDFYDAKHHEHFANLLISLIFRSVSVFVACFCTPLEKDDYEHGLLSQWRGYGLDGGYAIQFSKAKLLKQVSAFNDPTKPELTFREVSYEEHNTHWELLVGHMNAFRDAYFKYLDYFTTPLANTPQMATNPIASLTGGPIEALLDYLVFTKSKHFKEEREWRLAQLRQIGSKREMNEIEFLNRSGLIVPFVKTDSGKFDLLSCIDAIVVGPNPRMDARIQSVSQLVKSTGFNISVRPSGIPFTRV